MFENSTQIATAAGGERKAFSVPFLCCDKTGARGGERRALTSAEAVTATREGVQLVVRGKRADVVGDVDYNRTRRNF